MPSAVIRFNERIIIEIAFTEDGEETSIGKLYMTAPDGSAEYVFNLIPEEVEEEGELG